MSATNVVSELQRRLDTAEARNLELEAEVERLRQANENNLAGWGNDHAHLTRQKMELEAHIGRLQKAGLDALQCIRDHKWEEGEDPRLADLAYAISSTPADSMERLRKLEAVERAALWALQRFEWADTGEGFPRGSVGWAMASDLRSALDAEPK